MSCLNITFGDFPPTSTVSDISSCSTVEEQKKAPAAQVLKKVQSPQRVEQSKLSENSNSCASISDTTDKSAAKNNNSSKISKSKRRALSVASDIFSDIRQFFHQHTREIKEHSVVPTTNVLRAANIEPLKYPYVFKDKEVLDHLLDEVYGLLEEAKRNHSHRPNFKEVCFTFVPPTEQNNRPKLFFHKKGMIIEI